ncbi:MAG TPA: hypothetical protein VIM11_18625 [Tepidisphaeraceae bacterium]
MPVQLLCPNLRCRKFLAVPDDVRGKLVKCHHCQQLFRVPESKRPDSGPVVAAAGKGPAATAQAPAKAAH